MEYYDMPQVDKSASTYSPPVQYVPALTPRAELNKYGVSSDILTSCDWSAVIHRPAEDSEPEDLPSTVDMDAIKEPATPLPPMTPAPALETEDESDSEEESSNSDSDSSSESNSESQGSGSGSWSSDSSESSGKKASSSSSRSQSPTTTFSIRETNFEQGGLKLKLSATKPKTPKPRSSSSSSDPYDSSSSEDEESKGAGRKPESSLSSRSKREEKEKQPAKPEKKQEKVKKRTRASVKQRPLKRRQQSRPSRRSPRTKPNKESVSRGSPSSSSTGSESDESEEEEAEKAREDLTAELLQSDHSIPISEPLQVINEEDLAALLPDVGGGSLDGFEGPAPPPPPSSLSPSSSDAELLPEQVVSEAISRIQVEEPTPSSPHSSHDEDSDREEGGGGYSSNLLEDFNEKTEMLSRGPGGAGSKAGGGGTARRKRGRPPKPRPPPELETYPAQSNVSPDSGIQSVAGSPAHHPSPVASPDHRRRPPLAQYDEITKMQTSKGEMKLENGGKRGPGRPKGSGRLRKKRGKPAEVKKPLVLPPAATELKVPPYFAGAVQALPVPNLPGAKRGRGRPKKRPPPLELAKGRLRTHHHRHRRHHRRPLTVDPEFVAQLEELVVELERCTIGVNCLSRSKLDSSIPPVFRLKRLVKRRKGSERSRASDKESGPDSLKEELPQAPSATASPAHSSTLASKKRIKKSTVEIPKNREKTETANNEQRLPLKKRHYHISSAASVSQTVNDPAEKSDSSVEASQPKPVVERAILGKGKGAHSPSPSGRVAASQSPSTHSRTLLNCVGTLSPTASPRPAARATTKTLPVPEPPLVKAPVVEKPYEKPTSKSHTSNRSHAESAQAGKNSSHSTHSSAKSTSHVSSVCLKDKSPQRAPSSSKTTPSVITSVKTVSLKTSVASPATVALNTRSASKVTSTHESSLGKHGIKTCNEKTTHKNVLVEKGSEKPALRSAYIEKPAEKPSLRSTTSEKPVDKSSSRTTSSEKPAEKSSKCSVVEKLIEKSSLRSPAVEKKTEKTYLRSASHEKKSEKTCLRSTTHEKHVEKSSIKSTASEKHVEKTSTRNFAHEKHSEKLVSSATHEKNTEKTSARSATHDKLIEKTSARSTAHEKHVEKISARSAVHEKANEDSSTKSLSHEKPSLRSATSEKPIEKPSLRSTSSEKLLEKSSLKFASNDKLLDKASLKSASDDKLLDKTLRSASNEKLLDKTQLRNSSNERLLDKTSLRSVSNERLLDKTSLRSASNERLLDKTSLRSASNERLSEKVSLRSSSNEKSLDKSSLKSAFNEKLLNKTSLRSDFRDRSLDKTCLRSASNERLQDKTPLKNSHNEKFEKTSLRSKRGTSPCTVASKTHKESGITPLTIKQEDSASVKLSKENVSISSKTCKESASKSCKEGSTPEKIGILSAVNVKEKLYSDQKVNKNQSLLHSIKSPEIKTNTTSAIASNTRSASKNSSNSLTTLPANTPRLNSERKPPAGVFEPSAKVGALAKIIKLPDSPTKSMEEMISKIKERLQPVEKLEDISVKVGEDISVKVGPVKSKRKIDDDGDDKPKKRRVFCDVRVHVTKLPPTEFVLQNVMSNIGKHRLKMKRKINRTGFPIKRKKKKKLFSDLVPLEPIHVSPPVLEDQTKISVITSIDESTPALSPIPKTEDVTKTKTELQRVKSEPAKNLDEVKELKEIPIKIKDDPLESDKVQEGMKEKSFLKDDNDTLKSNDAMVPISDKVKTKDEIVPVEEKIKGKDVTLPIGEKAISTDEKEKTDEKISTEDEMLKTDKNEVHEDSKKTKEEPLRVKDETPKIKQETPKIKTDSEKRKDSHVIKTKKKKLNEVPEETIPVESLEMKCDTESSSVDSPLERDSDSQRVRNDLKKAVIALQKIKDERAAMKARRGEKSDEEDEDSEGEEEGMDLEEKCRRTEGRPSSRRVMELRSKGVASERRKRKGPPEDEEPTPTPTPTSEPPRPSIAKRLRRQRGDDQEDSDADSVKLRKKHPPRWKKKYLPAGLLSDYFKEDEPRKPCPNDSKKLAVYNRAEHEFGLFPPPAYCSKYVRQRKMHFQLPYDLWWLHQNNQLPGRDAVPSWNYKKIRTNVYFDVKPTLSYEAQACNCKASSGCGEECINRMVLTECSAQFCPCNESCSNQKIQKHEWAPGLVKFMTKDKGWGVKTKYGIKKDDFILEYVGEVVSEREFKARMASRYQNDTHHYCLNLDSGLVIDGHRMGGEGRFVNHSCEPNCEMQKWCVNGLFRMALFALRDISSNEELTYDYNFALFNPAEGQPCRCGSSKCRGVIGGKWQRVAVQGSTSQNGGVVAEETKPMGVVGRPKRASIPALRQGRRKAISTDKKIAKPTKDASKVPSKDTNSGSNMAVASRLCNLTPVRPLTHQQKAFVLAHSCFLVRNLEKVRRVREKLKQVVKGGVNPTAPTPPPQQVFLTQLTALSCPRNIRTRRLAQAEDNPEMTKTARLACIFKELYTSVTSAKDEKGELLSAAFMSVPSKKKLPEYYSRIQNPIDLTMIGSNITSGIYKTVESFDTDMMAVFKNAVKYYGRTTETGIAAARLRRTYNLAKLDSIPVLQEILGTNLPPSFIPPKQDPGGEEEDVIRCICGLYRDEGVMIQCERCLVWQHSWCVRANTSVEEYLCERCSPREVDLEIPAQPEHQDPTSDQTNYITLLRGEMLLKQGDTVYVLRDIVDEESKTVPKTKHTYKTIKNWKYTDCDIFRIERLWKDPKGNRFAFGHHYLRPHETFHEPTRKFFPNELMRVPLYEVVPVELVMGHCTVLDLNTFCKGRPIGSSPQHTYICEYRVDKNARIFAKISKPKLSNISTKSYAFEMYDQRVKPIRNYAPHGLAKAAVSVNSRGQGKRGTQEECPQTCQAQPTEPEPEPLAPIPEDPVAKRERQKSHLNRLLLRLLGRLPSKAPLDLSYLLEPGRRQRKKPPLLAS